MQLLCSLPLILTRIQNVTRPPSLIKNTKYWGGGMFLSYNEKTPIKFRKTKQHIQEIHNPDDISYIALLYTDSFLTVY